MIFTLVVTHGGLAQSLIESCRHILGDLRNIHFFTVDWDEDIASSRNQLADYISQVVGSEELLLLTDMLGGTPDNICQSFRVPGRVEVVTGVNLPMLVRAATLPPGMSIQEAARQVRKTGALSMTTISEAEELT